MSSHIRIYHTSKRKMRKRYQEMIIRQQGMSLTACRIPFGRCLKYLIAKIYAMVLLYINAWSTTMYFNIPGIFMHQSIPAVPIGATVGHLLTLSIPGVGHSQFYRGPGTGHLCTLGRSPAFDTRVFESAMDEFSGTCSP